MSLLKNKNFAFSALASGITISGTSLTVTSGEGSKFPSTGYFMCAIWGNAYSSPGEDTNREIVKMTLTGSDTFAITRAQEGSTAKAWSSGDNIALVLSAGKVDELEDVIQSGKLNYAIASGTNAYTAVFDPAITSYVSGNLVKVKFTNASTGVVTFACNALGLKKVYGRSGNIYINLGSGDIIAGMIGILIYDSTLDGGGGGWIFSSFNKDKLYEDLHANNKDITNLNDITSMIDIDSMTDINSMNDIVSMNDITSMVDIDSMHDIVSMNDITSMRDIGTSRNITFTGTLNSISTTIFNYLSGLTSNIQTQLNNLSTALGFGIPIGMLGTWPVETPPAKWLIRDGSAKSITTYHKLHLVLQGAYGLDSGEVFTSDFSTNTFTKAAHGRSNGDIIWLTSSNNDLPLGLTIKTDYYIINKTNDTFQVSLTLGGSVVNFTDNGSGTHYYHTSFLLMDALGYFPRYWDNNKGIDIGAEQNITGDLNSNTTINNIASTSNLEVGMSITGTGIPNNTTITSIYSATIIIISQAATITSTGVSLSCSNRSDRGDGTIGDYVGTLQQDENKSHTHQQYGYGSIHTGGLGGSARDCSTSRNMPTAPTGGLDSRGKNRSENPIIYAGV